MYESLPEILKAAAELLETDVDLPTDTWLHVLRVAVTTFRSTEALICHTEKSTMTLSSRQLFYTNLLGVVSLICNILSEDCPTPLEITRFLEYFMEAINDLMHQLSMAGVTEDTGLTKTNTLKLWLDTTQSELHTLRSLLPEDTPVFTCPFPLAGCTYQTTNMQQWILHKNQCYKRRSAWRTARPTENEANDILYRRATTIEDNRRYILISWSCTAPIREALRETAHNVTASFLPGHGPSRWLSREYLRESLLPLPSSPKCIYLQLLEALYRTVWFQLLRLCGLCIFSVLPMCTNMLGFVACWLTILQSVSMWKGKGIYLLSTLFAFAVGFSAGVGL